MLTTAFGRAKMEELCEEIGQAELQEMVRLKPKEARVQLRL